MRKYKLMLALLALWPCTAFADFGDLGHPVVVELYTSQGCSSCPPADKFLLELRKDENRNILPLSFHVDYWNSLGWTDTFSHPKFSERQRNYARHNGSRTIYTPQMIIDGKAFIVGSRKREVNNKINGFLSERARTASENRFRLKSCRNSDSRRVIFEGTPNSRRGKDYSLYFLMVSNHVASVDIARGENARRAISYGNVVQEIRELKWTDINFGIAEFRAEIDRDHQTGLVLLQENKFGPILASAEIVDDDCADLDRLHQSASLEAANVADVAMGVAAWADVFVSGEWFSATALNAAVLDSHGEHQVFKDFFESDLDAAIASIGERP